MHALIAALFNSLRGLGFAARTERAVRQELIGLAVGGPAALLLSEDLWTRVALVGSILIVLAMELLNTAIEKLCDHVTPQHHAAIGIIKDMGSAAVFCTLVLTALIWGAAISAALFR